MNLRPRSRSLALTALCCASLALAALPTSAEGAPPGAAAAAPAAAATPAPPTYETLLERHANVFQRFKPESRKRLEALGRELSVRLAQPPPANAKPKSALEVAQELARSNAALLGDLQNADIEALAFIVLMQAARAAEDDLKAILAAVKKQNQSKAQVRAYLAAVKAGTKKPDGGTDSLSELGEEQQLKLQMAMDRISKLEQLISNVLKKISDTQSAIIGNIK